MNNPITWLIILVALSAFFAAVETAFISLSVLKVTHMVESKKKNAKIIKKLKDNERMFLISILIGNNLVNIAAAAIATVLATNAFGNKGVGIATGIMTFVILVFGEITPKTIAVRHAEAIAKLTAWPVFILTKILYPIAWLFNMITKAITKSLGLFEGKSKQEFSEDELVTAVKASAREGSIKPIEKDIVTKVFKFDNMSVHEIMTARTDMKSVNGASKVREIVDFIMSTGHSRFPVYEGKHDNIVGILFIKDVMKQLKEDNLDISVKSISNEPFFVPETKTIDTLLTQFQRKKIHLAIVVDEHGGVAGLVSLEDVLEEIVGEIYDETDRDMPMIEKVNDNKFMVYAKASIDNVNKELNVDISVEEGYDTIGGFVLHKLGRIPKPNDVLEVDGLNITVENMVKQRILSLKIEKK